MLKEPAFEDLHYCVVLFEDPSVNRLEICYRRGK